MIRSVLNDDMRAAVSEPEHIQWRDGRPDAVWSPPADNSLVHWGSLTASLPDRPARWGALRQRLVPVRRDPTAHDVLVARIAQIGRHSGIELDTGRKARFFVGDVIVGAFGNRYATKQFLGEVPKLQDTYDMLSQGGVIGRVLSAPAQFSEPTVLEPLGFLADADGVVINLRRFGLRPSPATARRVRTILMVGSSMDSGKTTMAASLIHGLAHAGCRVHAGKVTGTACVKDLNRMRDAGAARVVDFARVGFASTAGVAESELHDLAETLVSYLSLDDPDYLVLEIADGLIQRETRLLMDFFTARGLVDDVCLAVHDVMAAPAGLELLQTQWGVTPTVVSGAATASPLSTSELRSVTEIPCLTAQELSIPSVKSMFDVPMAKLGVTAGCQTV